MQTHGGDAAEAAITSPERVFRARINVDWNNNGLYDHPLSRLDKYIIDVSTDRSLSGAAPEELLLIEGSSACEMTVNLQGELDNLSLISIFSPFNTLSPFYGKRTMDVEIQYSILVDTLFGTFEYPQFIGNIRTITPDRADHKVEITALDRAEKMRRPIQLPPFALSDEHVSYGEIDTQLIRSEWVIDHALRLCNSGVTPKRPVTRQELMLGPGALDGVQLWVTGNGSYLPSIGYLDNLNASSFPNPPKEMYGQNGPLHPAAPVGTTPPLALKGVGSPIEHNYYTASDEGVIRYWVADQDALNAAAVHFFGCTLYIPGSNIASIGQYQLAEIILGQTEFLRVYVQNGGVRVARYRLFDEDLSSSTLVAQTTPVTIPTNQGDHVDIFIQVDLRSSQTARAYVRAGTNTNGATGVTFGGPISSNTDQNTDQIKGRVTLGQAVTMSDFFCATSNQSDVPWNATDLVYRTPEYPAVLDGGLNRFSFIPTAKRQEAWTLVADVAAAEFGSVYWDEIGTFRFLNWESMLEKRNQVVRTFSLDDVENLSFSNNTDSIRNAYTVTTTKKRSAGIMNLYESQDQNEFYTPARTESRFRIWLDDVLSPLTWYMERFDGVKRVGTTTPAEWKEEYNEVASKLNWDKQGYVVQFYDGGTWKEVPTRGSLTDIRVTAYFTSDGYLTVRVRNRTSYDIRFAKDRIGNDTAGNPTTIDAQAAFRIAGTKILEGTTLPLVYENDTSIQKYGVRTLDLSGDWYQDALWTTDLLDVITPRSAEPVPTTDAITVAGDPRLQLGDVIRVTDAKGFGADIPLQIYGIQRTFSLDEGLTDTLTVEVVPPPPPPPDPDDPDPPQPFVPRFNICPNPACAVDDDGYWDGDGQATGVTGMSRSTGFRVLGGQSAIGPQAPVQRGKTYKFSAQVKGNGESTSGDISIHWYSNGGFISQSSSRSFSVGNGQVARVYTPAVVAPLGATKALVFMDGFSGDAIVTAVMYEQTDQDLPYFDGDSPGARWDGAAGSSSSRLVEPA